MPVFALYNFNDNTTVVDDAPLDGNQNGIYLNGASALGGQLRLDGVDDFAKIYPADTFQMDRGTLDIKFTPTGTDLSGPQTVLSRDSTGETPGGFHIDVNPDGSVSIVHETAGDTTTFTTDPGFYKGGDTINVVYSWDEGGTGGALQIKNMTDGGSFETAVPDSVTMDMGGESQPWTVGTGQWDSDPDMLNNLGPHFQGSVEYFSLSDTVDNVEPVDDRDGIVRGTDDGDLINGGYVDPWDGDRVDANDAIIPGDAPNDDRIRAGGGNDTIYAGTGDDTVWAGGGDDQVYGGSGDDDLRGGEGADTITGGSGNDTVFGQQDNDLIDTSGGPRPAAGCRLSRPLPFGHRSRG
jgi:hypothetical protein